MILAPCWMSLKELIKSLALPLLRSIRDGAATVIERYKEILNEFDFSIAIDDQKIATITWNCEKIIECAGFCLETLEKLIDQVIEDKNIKACILTSGKKDLPQEWISMFLPSSSKGLETQLKEFLTCDENARCFEKIELAGMDSKTKKGVNL